MKNISTTIFILVLAILGSQKSYAMIYIGQSIGQDIDPNFNFEDSPISALQVLLPATIVLFLAPPSLAIFEFLLDNPSSAVSETGREIETYGADSYESLNLATLFLNAQIEEDKSNRQSVITSEQVKRAAPKFFQTEGFSKMLKDFSK